MSTDRVFLNGVFLNSVFPFDLHWSAQDLADAVPLRLHELVGFDAGATQAANTAEAKPRAPWPRRAYATARQLPSFRVR